MLMNTFLNGVKRSTVVIWRTGKWWTTFWKLMRLTRTVHQHLEKFVSMRSPAQTNHFKSIRLEWLVTACHYLPPSPEVTFSLLLRLIVAARNPAPCSLQLQFCPNVPHHGQVLISDIRTTNIDKLSHGRLTLARLKQHECYFSV